VLPRAGTAGPDAPVAVQATAWAGLNPQSSGPWRACFVHGLNAASGKLTTLDGRETHLPGVTLNSCFKDGSGCPPGFLECVRRWRSVEQPGARLR